MSGLAWTSILLFVLSGVAGMTGLGHPHQPVLCVCVCVCVYFITIFIIYFFFFFAVLGFGLRAFCLLSRCSTAGTTQTVLGVFCMLGFF
jgi:hypothetical protein